MLTVSAVFIALNPCTVRFDFKSAVPCFAPRRGKPLFPSFSLQKPAMGGNGANFNVGPQGSARYGRKCGDTRPVDLNRKPHFSIGQHKSEKS